MNAAWKAEEHLTVEEYLKGEELSDVRREYIGGKVYAMPGVTIAHNTISVNLVSALHGHLRGGPCRVFVEGVKTHLHSIGLEIFYYPDVMVACDSRDTHRLFREYPKLIFEILSESTEKSNRFEKFHNYIQIETLEEYVFVEQDKFEITVYRRANNWKAELFTNPKQMVAFASVGLRMPMTEIYDQVVFP
jgi:Uma2 family endonuclease